MSDDLSDLPLRDADRRAREQIEFHRAEMGRWKRLRALRIALARETLSVEQIAVELGISAPTVYEVLRAAKKEGRPRLDQDSPAE